MKKLFACVVVALMTIAGAFAIELGEIQGTWLDAQWNAHWTFSADGKIVLSDSKSGETIFTFDDTNITDFKPVTTGKGIGISFYCKETERGYQFVKPFALSADLSMVINPDWDEVNYDVTITFEKDKE